MCGITGIINKDGRPIHRDELERLNNLAAHRGPDGDGIYIDSNVGLAHRRLSIIDLSDGGRQPMHGFGLTITFNGEIYNYIELKEQLRNQGYTFNSQSDTEVILAAYHAWGDSCVSKFNGMWAFAIWDPQKSEMFISRDRFGVKPLYFINQQNTFAFGSEIKQLLPLLPENRANHQSVFDYLFLGFHHHTENTFFENIKRLLPGHNLLYNLKTHLFSIKKHYSLKIDYSTRALALQESIDCYEEKLKDSIKLRLRSDVTVGTCLSGGLDSSAVAFLASEQYHKNSAEKFKAITAQSIEPETDETYYAKKVVDAARLDWYTTRPTLDDINRVVDEVIKIQEEPFLGISVVMQYYVMKKAKEIGCTVLLDGQGGDETLLGYERYYATYLNSLSLGESVKEYFAIAQNSKLSWKDLAAYKLYFSKVFVRKLVIQNRYSFIRKEYQDRLNMDLLKRVVHSYGKMDDLQLLEISEIQLPMLLHYEDRNSMHHSIEARVPFLDYRTVETALSLSLQHKIRQGWTKYPLRKIVSTLLPSEIAWRKAKFGFEAPKKTWTKKNLDPLLQTITQSNFVNSIIRREKLNIRHDYDLVWKLYNLARWAEHFNIKL